MAVSTKAKIRTLAECEEIIRVGIKAFREVGLALMEIRDNQLYTKKYGAKVGWDSYLKQAFNMTRQNAGQLIRAAQMVNQLVKDGVKTEDLPTSVRSANKVTGKTPTARKASAKKVAADAKASKHSSTRKVKGEIPAGKASPNGHASPKVSIEAHSDEKFREQLWKLIGEFRIAPALPKEAIKLALADAMEAVGKGRQEMAKSPAVTVGRRS